MAGGISRYNVLGVGVHAVDMCSAVAAITAAVREGARGYVCVTGAHGIIEAQSSDAFRSVLNRSLLTVPDGMPLVWIGRGAGRRGVGRVYGPDLMQELCRATASDGPAAGMTHFFYGGKPGVADELKAAMETRFPGIRVVGTYCPPFRPLTADEAEALREQVAAAKPDLFWVGLSTPKQEQFMAAHLAGLDARVMLGVGAAFDLHTGHMRDAPRWMKQCSLQWLHRLCQEPGRLGRRYAYIVPAFTWGVILQAVRLRRYPLPD
jgi:N-acetylglucosaminyldiphosphoundecaprenol N-acetyl-beta-D-mannosaminyltransferase